MELSRWLYYNEDGVSVAITTRFRFKRFDTKQFTHIHFGFLIVMWGKQ
jgi:hypothetical protein